MIADAEPKAIQGDVILTTLQNKRVLLLQGPVGPFFSRLRKDLELLSSTVFKINLNGGDWFFYSKKSIQYRGSIDEWPAFLTQLIARLHIDAIILFGDCRIYHRTAIEIARRVNVEIKVFEEGYFRPDYITLEGSGVNGYSLLAKDASHYRAHGSLEQRLAKPVGNAFWHAAMWAFLYYAASVVLGPCFKHYRHHRSLQLTEAFYWLRSLWRKLLYKIIERKIQESLLGKRSRKFFLVPLQTHNDYQINVHSSYGSIEEFIQEVVKSFAEHASQDTSIVIKHHPMDRAYQDYTFLIRQLRKEYALGQRLEYVHDLHLPSLLKNAIGVIVINSTVGLSALFHGAPVKACGKAIYDISGMTYQGELKCFWSDAGSFKFDRELYRLFRQYVIRHTQVNGNFYKKIPKSSFSSGVDWSMPAFKNEISTGIGLNAGSSFANSELQ
ncbi:capsular biosynthesis protein [Oxalobacteraceae bacterium R-40]|uniref:Capsular biosynthesis protein n=1 Tax=Keguizhuia sedimenti TaxID=3064264 RepID=A0ABU1BW85_9BURK|nr:capsular biosynthesis protein [Oxalobacteraceae bacterium R-40]